MPDLPEIEVIRHDLEKEIVGCRIKDAEVRPGTNAMKVIRRHGRRKDFQDLLLGAKVDRVERVGRFILLHLDNDHILALDLGATGQLLKTSGSEGIATHTHVVIGFTIGGQLRLVDPKRTAEVFVMPKDELEELRATETAIDPLAQQFTWHHFSSLLEERETVLKTLLMDDNVFCGLGDVYSDEVLFAAGLRYDRPSNKLTSQDVRRLYRALMETLQDAVRARGTTLGEAGFTDLNGAPGSFQSELKVYEREGQACPRCRSQIVKEQFDSRSTYLCAQCQS